MAAPAAVTRRGIDDPRPDGAATPRPRAVASGAAHAPKLATWRQRAGHAALLCAGWALFAWSWYRVTSGAPELGELRALVLGAALVVPALTLTWIVHNVAIYRRKGPRRAVPRADTSYVHDFAQRRIEADWGALRGARCIEITIDGEVKRYRAVVGGGMAPVPEDAAATELVTAGGRQ